MLPSIFGEDLFDDFFNDPFGMMNVSEGRSPLYGKHAKNLMKTDIREKEDGYELAVDLPGFKKDEISIDLSNGYLTIQAAKGLDKDEEDKKGRYIRRERYAGSMSRSFYVGDVKPEEVSAKFENGILTLDVPKAGQKKKQSDLHRVTPKVPRLAVCEKIGAEYHRNPELCAACQLLAAERKFLLFFIFRPAPMCAGREFA